MTGDAVRVIAALLAVVTAIALIGAQCGCTLHVHLWGKYTIESDATRGQEARGAQAGDGQDARATQEGNQRLMDEAERIATDGD